MRALCSDALASSSICVNEEIHVVRQQGAEHVLGARLEQELRRCRQPALPRRPLQASGCRLISPIGRNSSAIGLLRQRVDEAAWQRGSHLVHFALQEHIARDLRDRARLGEPRRVPVGNSATSFRLVRATNCAALRPAVTNTVDVLVVTPTSSRSRLVFSAPHSPLSVLTRITARFVPAARSSSGCAKSATRRHRRRAGFDQRSGMNGRAGQRRLLRLAHLRRRDHLHGLRDLRRVLDRLDASAYVACAGHGVSSRSLLELARPAAFSPPSSSSLSAFSLTIFASRLALRVVRNSVSSVLEILDLAPPARRRRNRSAPPRARRPGFRPGSGCIAAA